MQKKSIQIQGEVEKGDEASPSLFGGKHEKCTQGDKTQ